MQEKIEWEVVDDPMSQPGSQSSHSRPQSGAPQQPGMQQILKVFLGRWWRWKILGAVTFAALSMVLLAMLTGVFALLMAVGAVMAFGIGKVRQWARRRNGAVSI